VRARGDLAEYALAIRSFSRNARLFIVHVIGMDTVHGTSLVLVNLYFLAVGLPIEFIGLRLLLGGIAGAIFSVPAGFVSDRIGRKWSFIIGDGAGAALYLITIFSVAEGVLLATGMLAAISFGSIIARKRRRRKRRRAAETAIDRVVGAWHETLDTLTEADLADLSALTSAEVGESVRHRLGEPVAAHATRLGAAANVALFSSGSTIDTAAADDVWHEHDELKRSIRASLGLRPRLRMMLRTAPRRRRP